MRKKNILEKANDIVFNRSEEKDRQYGNFSESMIKTATIASILSNKEITPDDCYNVMIGLKLAREGNAHKEDNILDVIGYLAQKNTELQK